MIHNLVLNNPVETAIYVTINLVVILIVLGLIYYFLKPRSRRITSVYLSGEGEEVIVSRKYTPSPINLYWFFIKRFAKTIYSYLVESMHTGNLMDWIEYMISWYGLLILLTIIVIIIYMFTG